MKENLLRKIQKETKTKQKITSFFGEIKMIFSKNFINFIESFTKFNPNYVKRNKQTNKHLLKCLKSNVKKYLPFSKHPPLKNVFPYFSPYPKYLIY